MPYFRKKPVVVEARLYREVGLAEEIGRWIGEAAILDLSSHTPPDKVLAIRTLEGIMDVPIGHWVIRGVKGEHYSCDPDIFDKTDELRHA